MSCAPLFIAHATLAYWTACLYFLENSEVSLLVWWMLHHESIVVSTFLLRFFSWCWEAHLSCWCQVASIIPFVPLFYIRNLFHEYGSSNVEVDKFYCYYVLVLTTRYSLVRLATYTSLNCLQELEYTPIPSNDIWIFEFFRHERMVVYDVKMVLTSCFFKSLAILGVVSLTVILCCSMLHVWFVLQTLSILYLV